MFDDLLLQDYMNNFYGYGNWSGDYWFVGMEEGGGNSFADVQRRITIWRDRGRNSLEDLRGYHEAIGITRWFSDNPRLQSTWNKVIRVLLSTQGLTPQTDDIRLYQRTALGRSQADHCLIELLPLPSPSTSKWIYGQYSNLSFLKNRETYQNEILPRRIISLRDKIHHYQPRVVNFYSLTYQDRWEQIANAQFSAEDLRVSSNGRTLFVMMPHPVAYGLKNEDFHEIGQKIRTLIGSSP